MEKDGETTEEVIFYSSMLILDVDNDCLYVGAILFLALWTIKSPLKVLENK